MQTPACGDSGGSGGSYYLRLIVTVQGSVGVCVFPSKEDGKAAAAAAAAAASASDFQGSLPSKEDGKPPVFRVIARSKVTSMYANVSAGGKIIYTKSEEKEPAVVTAYHKLQADPHSYGAVYGKLLSLSNPTMKDLLDHFLRAELLLLLKENRISRYEGSRKDKSKVSRLICPSLRLICLSFRLICLSFRRRWPPICWS